MQYSRIPGQQTPRDGIWHSVVSPNTRACQRELPTIAKLEGFTPIRMRGALACYAGRKEHKGWVKMDAQGLAATGATRQLLLPVRTLEFAYRYGGLSSTRSIRVRFQVMSPVQEDMIGTDFGTQGVPRRATAFNWNSILRITATRATLPAFTPRWRTPSAT